MSTSPSDEFSSLWASAYEIFESETGVDLTKDDSALAQQLEKTKSSDEVLDTIELSMTGFNKFRAKDSKWGKIRNSYAKPFIEIILRLNDTAAEAASFASAPGGKVILTGFGVLLQATKGVSANYEALLELFEEMKSFIFRLEIRLAPSPRLSHLSKSTIVNTLVELLRILFLAKKMLPSNYNGIQTFKRRIQHYGKSLVGNREMQDALDRFKKLIKEDMQIVVAEMDAKIIEMHRIIEENHKLAHDADTQAKLKRLEPVERASIYAQDGPSCMQGTRIEILELLRTWSLDEAAPRIFWLNGMAGTGKSAIARSVCRELERDSLLGGSFFCSRGKAGQEDVKRIIPTLSASLATQDPAYCQALLQTFAGNNNLSVQSNLQLQVEFLLANPLHQAHGQRLSALIFVIDALDECKDENLVYDLLTRLFTLEAPLPIKFLITSRPEQHIRTQFSSPRSKLSQVLRLHDIEAYIVEADISLYLTRSFQEVRMKYSDLLAEDWPPPRAIDKLVKLSGKLFIYAFTSVQYVRENPRARLKALTKLHGDMEDLLAKTSKFSGPLDSLYSYVLSDALSKREYWEVMKTKQVITAILALREPLTVTALGSLLKISTFDLRRLLDRLHAVISVPEDDDIGVLSTFHASLGDFLTDPNRATPEILLTLSDGHKDLSSRCFQLMSEQLHFDVSHCLTSYISNIHQSLAAIPTILLYACLNFPYHLSATASEDTSSLFIALEELFRAKLLFWIEAVSAAGRVAKLSVLVSTVLAAAKLCKTVSPNFIRFLRDANEFVIFAQEAIETCVAHIYLSALPFTRSSSTIVSQFRPRFPMLPQIQIEGMTGHQVPSLIMKKHTESVTSVAYSYDGKQIVSGSYDRTVLVWDAQTGDLIAGPLEGHTDRVNAIAFSKSGTRVVSGSDDKTIRLWDAQSGELVLVPFKGHTGSVNSVVFSCDGTQIVSGSSDMTIRIWAVQTGNMMVAPLEGHTNDVLSVALSRDGTRIVSGSADWTVRIWDAHTGELIMAPLKGHVGDVNSIAFSPDGARIVSGSSDKTIRLWDVQTGELTMAPFEGHTDWIRSAAFSSDGRQIVSGSDDKTIRVWDAQTGELAMAPLEGHADWVRSVAFLSDGTQILSCSDDRTIRVWNAQTGDLAKAPLEGHTRYVRCVALSYDGTRIVSSSSDCTIRIWHMQTGALAMAPLEGHTDRVSSVAFSYDGTRIVSASDDMTIRVWDAQTGKPILVPLKGHTNWIRSVAFSLDGTRIVSGSCDKTIRVWDAHTGALAIAPLEGHTDWIKSVTFSHDGTRIASCSNDHTIRVWSAETGDLIMVPLEKHTHYVNSIAFSPDGTRIVSASDDTTIRVWNAQTGGLIFAPLGRPASQVKSVTFSLDGTRIVSGSSDGIIRVWDAQTGELAMAPLEGHTDRITSVTFSADGTRLVSGSKDQTIRVWDIETGEPAIAYSKTYAGSPISSSDERWNASSSKESTMYAADKQSPELQSQAPESTTLRQVSQTLALPGRDSWIRGPQNELLLWVPPEYRPFVLHAPPARCLRVIGRARVTVDLSNSVHGTEWVRCYAPQ